MQQAWGREEEEYETYMVCLAVAIPPPSQRNCLISITPEEWSSLHHNTPLARSQLMGLELDNHSKSAQRQYLAGSKKQTAITRFPLSETSF